MSGVSVTRQVADQVRRLRAERGWSARQLAEECIRAGATSLTRSTLAKIESGDRKSITADELAVLALVLHVSPSALLSAQAVQAESNGPSQASDGWYVESLRSLLRLDTQPIEAVEQRVIVAAVDGLDELSSGVSLPRHPDDGSTEHGLGVELLYGGAIERREQPYESYFKQVIAFPKPLHAGERHEYALRLKLPPGQPMAAHYVHTPMERSDQFDLRVRFDASDPPETVWKVDGAPPGVVYERDRQHEIVQPDRFGEVRVTFRELRAGLSYGLMWNA